jgi:small ligand-binding sensory domain FIST
MAAFTTDRFISAAASGTDWRETTRRVLEDLEQGGGTADMNVGFLYLTDSLADDAAHILGMLKTVTGIQTWVGTVSLGVCGCGQEYIDETAIAVMVGKFSSGEWTLIPSVDLNMAPARETLEGWLDGHEPMLAVVHGDPMLEPDPNTVLAELARVTGAFLVGGLSSSRGEQLQIAGDIHQAGISGVLFSEAVPVSTAMTQGCVPLGPVHTVTRCDGHMVMELDGQRAFDVFVQDLRKAAGHLLGEQSAIASGVNPPALPALSEIEHLFRGEVHVAFPVPESDQRDYIVRHAIGIDPEEGHIAVAYEASPGDRMMFVQRDDRAMCEDLSRTLVDLRERVIRERGSFAPKGALYMSCLARSMSDFGAGQAGRGPGQPASRTVGGEMKLVREVLGDIPLAGFYANGEISNHRLYGYTAVVILFH